MRHILESARHIEVTQETYVLVVGCRPGGLSAALAVARTGISVTLVGRFDFFGGNITASVMISISGVDCRAVIEDPKVNPQTYKDQESNEWSVETAGMEDAMLSRFLHKPFERATATVLIPSNLNTLSGTLVRFIRDRRVDLYKPGPFSGI